MDTLYTLLPASSLLIVACLLACLSISRSAGESKSNWLVIATLGLAGILTITWERSPHVIEWLLLGIGAAFALLRASGQRNLQYPAASAAMLLFSLAGALVVAVADDLVPLTLGWQLVVLPLCFLLPLNGLHELAVEATLKFVISSGLSMVILILGFVLLYALTGTTELATIGEVIGTAEQRQPLGVAAVVLIVGGLGFPLCAVPFHLPLADIVDGSDAWTAGLICTLPRIAATALLLRFSVGALASYDVTGVPVLLILAVVTTVGGAVNALSQNRSRRLVSYLSVAQTGPLLLCLAVSWWWSARSNFESAQFAAKAATWQLCASMIAVTCLFGVLDYLAGGERSIDYLEELTGLVRAHPAVTCSSVICLCSLVGFPPLLGFWSQAIICLTSLDVQGTTASGLIVIHRGFLVTVIVVIVGNLLMAVTVTRTVGTMIFEPPLGKPREILAWSAKLVIVVLAGGLVMGGILLPFAMALD